MPAISLSDTTRFCNDLRVHSPNIVHTSTLQTFSFDCLSCWIAELAIFSTFNFYWQLAPLLELKLARQTRFWHSQLLKNTRTRLGVRTHWVTVVYVWCLVESRESLTMVKRHYEKAETRYQWASVFAMYGYNTWLLRVWTWVGTVQLKVTV